MGEKDAYGRDPSFLNLKTAYKLIMGPNKRFKSHTASGDAKALAEIYMKINETNWFLLLFKIYIMAFILPII